MTETKARAEDRIRALPCWHGPVEIAPLEGGLSNESYTVTDPSGRYVVRFGHDFPFHHVFRDHELMVARAAHAAGFAPEVVHAAPGVTVSRFIEGLTFGPDDVRANIPRIARLLRRFHEEMPRAVSGPARLFWVFHVIRDYARTLREGGSRMVPRLPEFLALADEMEAAQVPLPIVFGHHDLLPANFIDDGTRLWLIDFEYAAFGTAMFDLAGAASNAGMGAEEAEMLIGEYLGHPPDRDFLRAHAAMQCASLLREAMWSMVSELHLYAPGVDYVAYTHENLAALDAALESWRTRFGRG
ncbi:MAG: choline kinase [Alphaproteobacteria bacterium]|nr:MAG: choline kinase [Alphaproteobacteria bacterium]